MILTKQSVSGINPPADRLRQLQWLTGYDRAKVVSDFISRNDDLLRTYGNSSACPRVFEKSFRGLL
jgi:hypothetical protein